MRLDKREGNIQFDYEKPAGFRLLKPLVDIQNHERKK
jgi:hypothetical protein